MTISLKHQFVSPKTDGTDSTLVQPSNWNAEHSLVMATARLVGRTTGGIGPAEEISVGSNLTFSGGQLRLSSSVSITALTASGAISGDSLNITGAISGASISVTGNSVFGGTGAVRVPVGTTAQRPTPAAGDFRLNTTTGSFEGYTGATWAQVGNPSTVLYQAGQAVWANSIRDASGGNTATINGKLPVDAADVAATVASSAVGLVLLGTISTGAQTLSSLVLTGYRQLFFEFNGLSHNGGTGTTVSIGAGAVHSNVTNSDLLVGGVWVSLWTGIAMPVLTRSGGSLPTNASGQIAQTGYTTATTSVAITFGSGSVDAGSVRVYGVK